MHIRNSRNKFLGFPMEVVGGGGGGGGWVCFNANLHLYTFKTNQ